MNASLREFVKNCSSEEKDAVMGELLKEARALHPGSHMIPLADSDGAEVGYFVSLEAARQLSDKVWKELPHSVALTLGRSVDDLDDSLSPDELKEQLRLVEAKQHSQ